MNCVKNEASRLSGGLSNLPDTDVSFLGKLNRIEFIIEFYDEVD